MMYPPDTLEVPNRRVSAYNQQKFRLKLVSMLVSAGFLIVMGLWGGLALDQLIKPLAGGNQWLEVVLLGVALQLTSAIVSFPVHYQTSYVVEHRFDLSRQSFGKFMLKWAKMSILMLIFGPLLLSGVYGLIWAMPTWWWLAAAVMMTVISGGIGMLVPVVLAPMFYEVEPVKDTVLLERFQRIASFTTLGISEVCRIVVSNETVTANACMVGMGKSKRVFITDTLLDGFTPEELEVVLGHELGHYKHAHLVKMLLCNAIVTLLGFLVVNVVLNAVAAPLGHASVSAPSTLALFLLAMSTMSAIAQPVQNFIFRRFEFEADEFALHCTGNTAAFCSTFTKLVRLNNAEMHRSWWKVLLFDSHPSTDDRIERAKQRQRELAVGRHGPLELAL